MKKIVSLMTAVVMLSSIFVTSVFAADFPVGPAVLNGSARLATEEEAEAYATYLEDEIGEELGAGDTLYAVDVAISGLGSFTNANTPALPQGVLPELVLYKFDFGADFSKVFSVSDEAVVLMRGLLADGASALTGGTAVTIKYLLNDGKSLKKNVPAAEGEVLLTALIALSSNATATVTDGSVTLGEFLKSKSHTDSKDYKPFSENISFSPASLSFGSTTVDVTGVTLDKSELKLKVGKTYDLTETVEPDKATDKSVTYSSNNTAVATVNATTGVVTAVAVGTATITVTTTDGEKTATCAVTVYNDVAPKAEDAKIIDSTIDGLKDVNGAKVTIDPSRSYGAAKFENVDLGAYNYKIVATDADGNEKEFEIADGDLEVSGTASFIAIVWSATRTIASVVLRAFNN